MVIDERNLVPLKEVFKPFLAHKPSPGKKFNNSGCIDTHISSSF